MSRPQAGTHPQTQIAIGPRCRIMNAIDRGGGDGCAGAHRRGETPFREEQGTMHIREGEGSDIVATNNAYITLQAILDEEYSEIVDMTYKVFLLIVYNE